MIGGRSALLAASLLVAAPAVAAQPEGGHYVWVPTGATVVLVPSAPVMEAEFPVARMIAQQEAMMNRMMADMDSLMATMPDPQQMIRSVMQGMPQEAPGSGVVVTSISTGSGTCSQTITYGDPGNGGQPTVRISNSGNACGVLQPSGPINVMQPQREPQQVVPVAPATPRHERLWTVGYPPHPITTGTPPRT